MISKFRKISQENRAAASNNPGAPTPPTSTGSHSGPPSQSSPPLQPQSIGQSASTDINDFSTKSNTNLLAAQHLQLPPQSSSKPRDKLETISERIETQESQISQITSLNQSPPLHRPPKSSKWKWLKTGSTEPGRESPPRQPGANFKTIQQPTINPFDSNLTDEDLHNKAEDGSERRLSIPLSLFIPRSARDESTKASTEGSDDQVKNF